jgi:hypothetical protein
VPIRPPPIPAPVQHYSRDTALIGASILGGVLAVLLATGALAGRLRRD